MLKEIENLGLTKRETDTYIALLGLGSSTIGDIVKKSKVPSSKVYEVLNKLISKGLASFIIKGKTKYFQASDPESLLDIIDEKKQAIQKIIPQLKQRQNSSKEEKAMLFEGISGMKTALRKVLRILKPNEEYLVYISEHENMNSEYSQTFFNNFNLKRDQAKIKTKLLIHKSHKATIKKNYPTLSKQQVKYTDFSFPSRLGIFKDHVLIISHKKNTSSILIQSPETYELYRSFFLGLWN
jgi:HTH-type transcriptional regulator, sugar sensing transcriptional regulator